MHARMEGLMKNMRCVCRVYSVTGSDEGRISLPDNAVPAQILPEIHSGMCENFEL